VKDIFGFGDHGSTFGGNPVACAAALSVVSRLTDELLGEVTAKGNYLRSVFTGAPGIESVSGLGLMVGLKTTRPAGEVVRACMDKGVLLLTAKDRVRLLPALNIPAELLEKAADVICAVCAE
jgi:acetylornithine/N-succinyldiaminopimelate aminotransferase